jgi:hypothetical protein
MSTIPQGVLIKDLSLYLHRWRAFREAQSPRFGWECESWVASAKTAARKRRAGDGLITVTNHFTDRMAARL